MRPEIPEKYLRPVVVGTIIFLAGPEIRAASEMLALVELIGAASFIWLCMAWHSTTVACIYDESS
jgi:hypothetical protein